MLSRMRKAALVMELKRLRKEGVRAQAAGRKVVYTLYLLGLIGGRELAVLRAWTYSWL